jgi:hypothetical protein
LIRLEDEVLAQARQVDRGAGRAEMRIGALKPGLLGQHRETGSAAGGVGAGQRRRLKVRPDQALAGRGLLDLGDERQPLALELRL